MSEQKFSAVLLNLDRDTVRLDHMTRQLGRAGIKFARLSGVLGDAVPDDLRHYFFHADGKPKSRMKRGEIGCYASHLRALTRVATGTLGSVAMIMEDDLEIATDMAEIVSDIVRLAPVGWDIVRLSCPPRRAYIPCVGLRPPYVLARYSKIPNSAGAYLITPQGARKFLSLGVRGLTYDDDLRRPWFHGMETFGVVPPPIKAGVLTSSIDSIEAGRFDKGMSSCKERIWRGDHAHTFRRLIYNVRNFGVGAWLACWAINFADMLVKWVAGRSIISVSSRVFPLK